MLPDGGEQLRLTLTCRDHFGRSGSPIRVEKPDRSGSNER